MLAEYIRAFELYKDSENLLDYNDVLERYHRDGGPLDFDVMVVDEAQDLSVIQWKVLQTMTETCRDTIVAGDDDQTIYAFAGVNVKHFINWKADEVRVLSQSFRLPGPIHEYSMDALSMIEHRMEKEFRPAPHKGNVFVTNEIDPINDIVPYESCAILHRNGYIAAEIRQKLNRLLIPYLGKGSPYNRRTPLKAIRLWEDWRAGKPLEVHNLWTISKYLGPAIENFDKREKADRQSKAYECPYKDIPWYIALKMDSLPLYKCVYDTYGLEVLTDTPRLTVTTIHQAKGGEWDKVIVLTDVSTATYEQFKNGSEADRDAEARVWYVALTRARKCLQIIRPHTHKFYPLKGVT
jgi:superfamily I DNA/RNA helicase